MKQLVQIVTDSSCDLSRKLVEKLKVAVVPLVVRFGAEVYDDGDLSSDEFWSKAAGAHPPQSSQPSVGAFEEVFERIVEGGRQILCVTITSKHSGTFNAASLAAQQFGDAIQIFDSLSLSLGLGFQVTAAAQAAQAGHSMQEILVLLADLRSRVHMMILLDTLENLRYGGRAADFIAVVDRMARAFDIKPIINVVDGKLRLLSAVRSFRSGLRRLMDQIEQLGPLERLAVVHTRREQTAMETADRLAERIGFPRDQIWVREAATVLASHAGEGTIGIVAVSAK